jgi:hypothetical protein
MSRLRRLAGFVVAAICVGIGVAIAALPLEFVDNSNPAKSVGAMVIATLDVSGHAVPVSTSNPLPAGAGGGATSGTPTQATVSCANTSTTLLAAAAAATFIRVAVPPAGATVWVNWAGAAAVTASPSDSITAGNAVVWTSFVPTSQLNCIVASGSQAVTLVYK